MIRKSKKKFLNETIKMIIVVTRHCRDCLFQEYQPLEAMNYHQMMSLNVLLLSPPPPFPVTLCYEKGLEMNINSKYY